MIQNKNPYDSVVFAEQFSNTEIFSRLQSEFDVISFDKFFRIDMGEISPRQWFATRIFSAVPFYYLDFLLKQNPTQIHDLGCGWNIFKKYIPSIIGIGAENPNSAYYHADIHDHYDEDFLQGHQAYFESLFAINSLHFIPLSRLRCRVQEFFSMLKPNGSGFISFNIARMLEMKESEFDNKDAAWLDEYIRKQLDISEIDYLVFDVDLSELDEWINGNIRLVLYKH